MSDTNEKSFIDDGSMTGTDLLRAVRSTATDQGSGTPRQLIKLAPDTNEKSMLDDGSMTRIDQLKVARSADDDIANARGGTSFLFDYMEGAAWEFAAFIVGSKIGPVAVGCHQCSSPVECFLKLILCVFKQNILPNLDNSRYPKCHGYDR